MNHFAVQPKMNKYIKGRMKKCMKLPQTIVCDVVVEV